MAACLVPPQYPFRHAPFAHQLECWTRSRDAEFYGLLYEMGCGKSKSFIDTAAWLYDTGKIDGVVVTAPKGNYDDWYDEHFPGHLPTHIKYQMEQWVSGPSMAKKEALRKIFKAEPGKLHVLVMNCEAIIGKMAYDVLAYFLRHHKCLWGVDESTTIGNPQARRTKDILKLRDLAKYRRIMTGDSAPNSPLTVWSQMEFLKPGALGYGSYHAFKAEFCQQVKQNFGGRRVMQIVGFQNLEVLQKRMSESCFIVRKADCLDLPEKLPAQTRKFEMGEKQKSIYKQMKDEAIAYLDEKMSEKPLQTSDVDMEDLIDAQAATMARCSQCGEMFSYALLCPCCGSVNIAPAAEALDPTKTISASEVIVQLLRLHQIACGFYTDDAGVEHDFDETNPQLELLLDTMEEVSGKAIIWACYRRNIAQIEAAITKKYGAETVVTYFGDTTQENRRAAKLAFQDPASPVRWFVANQATGKYGLTLTAGNTAIYYSQGYDQEARAQSEDRIHRIGQKSVCTYVDLVARGTVGEKILRVLRDKKQLSALISPSNWKRLFE